MSDFLGFWFMVILNLYEIPFHAVVAIRPPHTFLFKSTSTYCDKVWSGLILIADVADFVSDAESHVLQNSIYVAMATSVAVIFLDPIANVQGLACLAWANKVNWNTEKHQLNPEINIDKKSCRHLLFIMHYKPRLDDCVGKETLETLHWLKWGFVVLVNQLSL